MGLQNKFSVHSEVYNPSDDSFLLEKYVAEYAGKTKNARVLDVGTGSGIQAIAAAQKGAGSVLAIDVNEFALKCAKENALRNGVAGKIEFRKSDLFSNIGGEEKFDLIVFNPPYLPTGEDEKCCGKIDAAWNGGENGRKVIDRFLKSFAPYLTATGKLLMLHCDLANTQKTISILREKGFKVKVLEEKQVFNEKLAVLLASH